MVIILVLSLYHCYRWHLLAIQACIGDDEAQAAAGKVGSDLATETLRRKHRGICSGFIEFRFKYLLCLVLLNASHVFTSLTLIRCA